HSEDCACTELRMAVHIHGPVDANERSAGLCPRPPHGNVCSRSRRGGTVRVWNRETRLRRCPRTNVPGEVVACERVTRCVDRPCARGTDPYEEERRRTRAAQRPRQQLHARPFHDACLKRSSNALPLELTGLVAII